MGLNAGKVLKICITTAPKKEILEYVQKYLSQPAKKSIKAFIIVTPNAEQIVRAQSDVRFRKIINQADVALPDGFPVARMLGIARIPGVEFMEDLVALAAQKSVPIGLIGGRAGVAVEAFECLQRKYPGLTTAKQPRIIFVGLGAPKQEYFINENSKKTNRVVYMAVGGSFDIIAGRLKRAPLFIRSIGFEWAWRLIQEPWRWRRQRSLVKFMWLVLRERW